MAVVYAVKSGNWSDPTVWNTGSLPSSSDQVRANGYTVTIDMDVTVVEIGTGAAGGAGNGGGFSITTARTCNFNVIAGTTTCLTVNAPGLTVNITGNITGGSASNACGVRYNSSGTVNITGNVTGGSVNDTSGVFNNSSGTVNITGNVTGGSVSNAYGVNNYGPGTVNITGDCLPNASTAGYEVYNLATGQIFINGDVYSGRGQTSVYAYDGRITINGDLRHDVTNGNAAAIGTSLAAKIILNGNIRHHYGTTGYYGLSLIAGGSRVLLRNGAQKYTEYAEDDGSGVATGNPVVHYGVTLHSGSFPAVTDVRYGVSYGPAGVYVGTCHVPAPASVLYGVPVDHTTGTAVVTAESIAAAVWDALRSEHTATGTFGAVSEWAGGGSPSEIADAVWDEPCEGHSTAGTFGARVDDAISTRLATSAYTPPDNTGIAGIKEQTDKLSFAGTGPWDVKATLDGETVTVQTNQDKTGYSLSSEAYGAVADVVWDEPVQGHSTAGTFGARVDDAISTRLATSGYTPPDNTGIAAIKEQTDKLSFAGTGPWDVKATLDGETVTVQTNQDKTGYSLSSAGIGAVAGAVWDEPRSDHTLTGTFGAVSEWAGGGGGGASPSVIADAVWDELLSEHIISGSAGEALAYTRTQTAKIGDGTEISVTNPVGEDGTTLTLVRGDDYFAADGRALEWSSGSWPNLTGAQVKLAFYDVNTEYEISQSGVVINPGGVTQTVRVELSATTTRQLVPRLWPYDVQATLSSGHVVTLVRGNAVVVADYAS